MEPILGHYPLSEWAPFSALTWPPSGVSRAAGTGDMRQVLVAVDGAAALAVAVFVRRLRAGVAAMTAAMDALMFSGGVGEHAAGIRERAVAGLGFLGVGVDAARNAGATDCDADISADGARVPTLVVAAREDLEIAREVRAVIGGRG